MFPFLRWPRPAKAIVCPFHRFIKHDGTSILVRRDAVAAIEEASELVKQQGTKTFICIGGHYYGVANSIENVLESVWDREDGNA